MNWSPQQIAVFNWMARKSAKQAQNLCVVARAGTGKSTTIREAINHASERDILICAFNKRIQLEMSERLRHPTAECQTLHALGFSFIRAEWRGTRVDADRGRRLAGKVAGSNAPDTIVTLVAKLASLAKSCAPFGSVAELIEVAVRFDLVPDPYWSDDWPVERIAAMAREAMQLACQRDGTIDFDDQVFVPVAAKLARPRYDLVIVDEAQDMDPCKLMLAQRVCRKAGRMVIVGDDRQAIYGWRGADSDALARMQAELSADLLPLTVTYRCPKAVVAEAQRLVPDFTAHESAPEGSVSYLQNTSEMLERATYGQAILSRKNAPLVSVCLSLLRQGKRARIEGRELGQNLVGLINKLRGRSNDLGRLLERLNEWKQAELAKLPPDADQKAEQVCDKAETLVALAEDLTTVDELIARVKSLFDDSDKSSGPAIVCSSIHKAKGLEWSTVYILRETLYARFGNQQEEINLHYVAATRSKDCLVYVGKPKKSRDE